MSERFNLEYLNTFMIAAETGKFNTTAELVYLSHSSVSTQIKKLEDQVGTLLFIRNKDTLTLTQTGETLYNYAKKILELNDKAFNSMSNSNWEGAVTFGLPTDYSQLYLQRIYPLLKKKISELLVFDCLFKKSSYPQTNRRSQGKCRNRRNGAAIFRRYSFVGGEAFLGSKSRI